MKLSWKSLENFSCNPR